MSHFGAVFQITFQFELFATDNKHFVAPCGEAMRVANEFRNPDLVLVPEDNLPEEADMLFDNVPRVIVEVDVSSA